MDQYMLEHGSGSALSVSKKSAWSIIKFSIPRTNAPIAISLGSYMDKAVGRRTCTRKNVTKDVSALVWEMFWCCLGDFSVLFWRCFADVSLMPR